MTNRLPKPFWIFPLALAAVVALFGWWGNRQLRGTIDAQLKAELTTTLEANVTALEIWATNQTKLVIALADEPKLRDLASQLFSENVLWDTNSTRQPNLPELAELEATMKPRLTALGYSVARLVSTNFVYVTAAARGRFPIRSPVYEEHVAKFTELFASGQPVIITPFKPKRGPPPMSGRMRTPPSPERPESARSGEPSTPTRERESRRRYGFSGSPTLEMERLRRGDLTLMQVAAPVRDAQETLRGAMALIINPDAEFSRILSVARSGQSGETYAFDQRGLLISRSRFDDQLKQLGLIPNRPGVSSALNLRLADPGVDRPERIAPEETGSSTRPLTRLVAEAVTGGSGVNLEPSRDYRGVQVVGAWRWLPQYGFGVVTQIDATEAYRPLGVLKWVFLSLVLLLLLCSIGMIGFSYANLVWRRRLNEVELKLKQLGQYTLEDKIGEGGMGVVYRARHAMMRRETAVKLLLPDRADPEAIARFEREVCLTCQLTHPNTIQVYDYGHTPDGIFYYAMEYLRGMNLRELVGAYGPQPEKRVVHILTQICDALEEAHALGLVHRDIKPANVFLCERGGIPDSVKVLDFGLVHKFHADASGPPPPSPEERGVGTPGFIPPEAINNAALSDPRSDIYSIGALGYYLLTGQYVFDAEDLVDLFKKHLLEKPVAPSQRTANPISPQLESALLQCLEKSRELRPSSAAALRDLLMQSPFADGWTLQERIAWWRKHQEQARSTAAPVRDLRPSQFNHLDATVKVDFQDRLL
ncbi:MAG: serine/threonine protein kinase [Verrucomicrobiota bacterium]